MLLPSTEIHGYVDGKTVQTFTLKNKNGLVAKVSELGAHLTNVILDGDELTLGHDSFEGWMNNSHYLGSSCGRFGNRIAYGEFTIDDQSYSLSNNNSPAGIPCHLHGGSMGFHTKIWKGTPLHEANRQGVVFALHSPNGDEGYPGNLEVTVTYWLDDNNELSWLAQAKTDRATIVNLVNHTYWNLSGNFNTPITDHQIQIHADYFLTTNAGMIPTGEIHSVTNTPLDFTSPQLISKGINSDYKAIKVAGGYDHCWVLRDHHDNEKLLQTAAVVHHPYSGRTLEIQTNQLGIQFYTGNFLSSPFVHRSGLCLETQGFPDSPNHPNFPSAIIRPGETYHHELVWKLSH